ncbi:uncharacterized protein PG986_009924 [Apiospora aurea]|uniref:Uncharacterized protein n=1 Tax=Apiospora aurea TaxID=335848 RepID=A0ABR1Q921_9PEZI
MAEEKKFEPTHVFTHPYAKPRVLRKYLIEKAKMKPSQFRIQSPNNKVQLMILDPSQKIEQKQREEIIAEFVEAERKRKLGKGEDDEEEEK